MKIANINLHSFRIHLQFDTLMKIKISQIFLFFSTLLLLYNSCRGIDLNSENQLHQDNIHISKWYRGASSAMAFMWDDTNANHYTSVGPLFDSFGYHTSFGVITISLNDHINGYKSLVANGHEICSHSVTHTNPSSLTQEQIIRELKDSKESISNSLGVFPTTFIHPFDITNNIYNKFLGDYYLYSRIYNQYQDSTNSVVAMLSSFDYDYFVSTYNLGVKAHNWITYAGHGLDGQGWEAIKSSELNKFLHFLKFNTNTWVDTYSRIAIYNEVRLKVKSVEIGKNFIKVSDAAVNYSRFVPFKISEIPITIEIESNEDLFDISGDNIIEKSYNNKTYFITINLLKGNTFYYTRKII